MWKLLFLVSALGSFSLFYLSSFVIKQDEENKVKLISADNKFAKKWLNRTKFVFFSRDNKKKVAKALNLGFVAKITFLLSFKTPCLRFHVFTFVIFPSKINFGLILLHKLLMPRHDTFELRISTRFKLTIAILPLSKNSTFPIQFNVQIMVFLYVSIVLRFCAIWNL